MSLHLGKIKRGIVKRSLTSPVLGGAANIAGKVLSAVSFGHYKVDLTRTAFQLSQKIKPGDVLKFRSGQVIKENIPILTNQKLFNGVNIDGIEVTDKMCTPEGMASYLRWEAIGNAPSFMASSFSLLGKMFFVDLLLSSLYPFQNNINCELIVKSFIATLGLVPFHKILKLFVPAKYKNGRSLRLNNVEGFSARTYYFPGNERGFFITYIPDAIFLALENKYIPLTSIHEKSHLLGASEYMANKMERQKLLKLAFYEGGLCLRNIARLRYPLFSTLVDNLRAISYIFIKNNYHENSCILSGLANNKQKLNKLISEFEKGETKLSDITTAQMYKMAGKADKALFYYQKTLAEIERERDNETISHKAAQHAIQGLNLAIALTLREIQEDGFEKPDGYFRKVVEAGKGLLNREIQIFSSIAQAELEKLQESPRFDD